MATTQSQDLLKMLKLAEEMVIKEAEQSKLFLTEAGQHPLPSPFKSLPSVLTKEATLFSVIWNPCNYTIKS